MQQEVLHTERERDIWQIWQLYRMEGKNKWDVCAGLRGQEKVWRFKHNAENVCLCMHLCVLVSETESLWNIDNAFLTMVFVQVKQPVDKLFHLTAAGNKTSASDPDRQESTININKNSVFLEGKKIFIGFVIVQMNWYQFCLSKTALLLLHEYCFELVWTYSCRYKSL